MCAWEIYTGETRAKKPAECVMSISSGGILYLGKGPMEQYGITAGLIMMRIDKAEGKIGFHVVPKWEDGAFDLKADSPKGKVNGYRASISSFLRNVAVQGFLDNFPSNSSRLCQG